MRRPHKISILSIVVALGLALPAVADEAEEASLDTLVATLQANKTALVAVNMDLDETEAAAFWPLYERYQADLLAVSDRFVAIIDRYTTNFKTMTDDEADQILEDFLEVELERAEVRKKYRKPFSKILPGRKVVRFYQIENKIQAVLRYELAQGIPVIDE
jgi:hypothetical protein